MPQKDEKDLGLPAAPPPSPAKREAAIEMALRRFDGAQGREAEHVGAKRPPIESVPERKGISRPQVGLLVSVALIAVIGLPTVRKIMEEPPVATHPAAPAPAPKSGAPFEAKPKTVPMPATGAPPAAPEPSHENAAPEPIKSDDRPDAEGRGESAPRPAPASPVMASAPPPPPAAPASPAMEKAARAPGFAAPMESGNDGADIIVSAQRVDARSRMRSRRGDWNACTVNDPARNLDTCDRVIGRSDKGDKGGATSHVSEGLTRAWRGDDAAAIAEFDQAIAISPKLAIAYLNRGLSYRRQGDLDRAIADLDQAARYNSGSARILYNRSLLLRERGQKGDVRKAEADEQRALGFDPDYDAVID